MTKTTATASQYAATARFHKRMAAAIEKHGKGKRAKVNAAAARRAAALATASAKKTKA